ncbi:MAG: DUF4364 family protein [Bacillota bacterium]|nr:DUF4364 family protein [Bacillota bacterium]
MELAELAINKLIILSILNRIPGVTLGQLTTIALETLYMDYFDFVTAFEELCRDQMANESIRKGETALDAAGRPVTRCDMTPEGKSVYLTLEHRIPLPIRSYLAQACSSWRKDIRMQNILTASCDPDGNGLYRVRLRQSDGIKDLIDLALTIPDKTMGLLICERWKRHPQTVYLGLLSLLTGEPTPVPDQGQFTPDSEQTEEAGPRSEPPDPLQQSLFESGEPPKN